MTEQQVEFDYSLVQRLEDEGKTVVLVANRDRAVACWPWRTSKNRHRRPFEELARMGIDVYMLTEIGADRPGHCVTSRYSTCSGPSAA